MKLNPKETFKTLKTKSGSVHIYHLPKLDKFGFKSVERLPYSIKVLLESALRSCDDYQVTDKDITRLANWSPKSN